MKEVKIKVCDAIMGSGKSSAAITYMNENPDKKFIYVTPYLDEAYRIKESCQDLNFKIPIRKKDTKGSKVLHTLELVKSGYNITSTHQALRGYTGDLYQEIKNRGYTLIIDESIEAFEEVDILSKDIDLFIKDGYLIDDSSGIIRPSKKECEYSRYSELFRTAKAHSLIRFQSKGGSHEIYSWLFPFEFLDSFNDIYILTYLFESSTLYGCLKMLNMPYKKIGVTKSDEHVYRFCNDIVLNKDVGISIKDKIHILNDDKLDEVGKGYSSLSINWFNTKLDEVVKLKKNLNNLFKFKFICENEQKMYCTFKSAEHKIKGLGYTKGFVVFNERATNRFKHKTHIAYCSNVFMNVSQKLFFASKGIYINEDLYALSTMIQCIWRSAIRDKRDIYIYIPSRRMRELFIDWLDIISTHGDINKLKPVQRKVWGE